jgi:hypothetical protein
MSLHKLYYIILQVVLSASLLALYLGDVLLKPFQSESKWFCLALVCIWAYGMVSVLFEKWLTASWIAAVLVRIGIVGMIVGVIGAVGVVSASISLGDMNNVLSMFLSHIGVALYASLVALSGNLILEANIFFLGGDSEG